MVTGPAGSTSVPGVWVAGNVANPKAQVVTAAGEGSAAAIDLNAHLVDEDVQVATDERFTAARMVTEHLSLYRHLSRRDLQQARMRGRTSARRALRAPGTSTSRQLR